MVVDLKDAALDAFLEPAPGTKIVGPDLTLPMASLKELPPAVGARHAGSLAEEISAKREALALTQADLAAVLNMAPSIRHETLALVAAAQAALVASEAKDKSVLAQTPEQADKLRAAGLIDIGEWKAGAAKKMERQVLEIKAALKHIEESQAALSAQAHTLSAAGEQAVVAWGKYKEEKDAA